MLTEKVRAARIMERADTYARAVAGIDGDPDDARAALLEEVERALFAQPWTLTEQALHAQLAECGRALTDGGIRMNELARENQALRAELAAAERRAA